MLTQIINSLSAGMNIFPHSTHMTPVMLHWNTVSSRVLYAVWCLAQYGSYQIQHKAQKRFSFFFFLKEVSFVSYLNLAGFICHMSCVKLYPVVLPGGQTEGLRGPRTCKVWQQTVAFTLGNVSVVNDVSFPMCSTNPFPSQLGF